MLKFVPDQVDRLLHFLRDIGRFLPDNVGWTGGFVKAWAGGRKLEAGGCRPKAAGQRLVGEGGDGCTLYIVQINNGHTLSRCVCLTGFNKSARLTDIVWQKSSNVV